MLFALASLAAGAPARISCPFQVLATGMAMSALHSSVLNSVLPQYDDAATPFRAETDRCWLSSLMPPSRVLKTRLPSICTRPR